MVENGLGNKIIISSMMEIGHIHIYSVLIVRFSDSIVHTLRQILRHRIFHACIYE